MLSLSTAMIGTIGCVSLLVVLGCFIGMFFIWLAIRRVQQKQGQLASARLVKISKAKKGLVKIKGNVRAQDELLRSPLSNKPCVYYRFHVEKLKKRTNSEIRGSGGYGRAGASGLGGAGTHGSSDYDWDTVVDDTQWTAFTIEDATGEIDIEIEKAEVIIANSGESSSGTFASASARLEKLMRKRYGQSTRGLFFNKSMRYTEYVLTDGDKVLAVGDVKKRQGMNALLYKGDHHLVLSDMDERTLSGHYTGRTFMYWLGMVTVVVFMIALCSFMIWFAVKIGKSGGGANEPDLFKLFNDVQKIQDDIDKKQKNPFEPIPPAKELIPTPKPIDPNWDEKKMTFTFLSDMQEIDPKVGWGKFGKNGEHGYVPEGVPGATNAIIVQGKRLPKALSMHPPDGGEASVKYQLDRQYKLFRTQAAFQDMPVAQAASPQTYKVYGDGQLLWISAPPNQRKTDVQTIRISVENVNTLELRVHCAGSKVNAWTVWVTPRLLK